MSILTFANGTQVEGYVMESYGALFIYIYSGTIAQYYPLVSNVEAISTIVQFRYQQETEYKGYNHLYTISEEPSGMLTVGLKKV